MTAKLRKFLSEISEAVFPSNIYCLVCGSMIDRSRPYGLCDSCVHKMHWITGGIRPDGSEQRLCAKCGKALPDTFAGDICYDCMQMEHCFSRGFSCLTYGKFERDILMDIKYHGKGYAASKMGEILFDRMEGLIAEGAGRGITPFDAVVPVPVSESRLRQRGYNQSELMAASMVRRWREFAEEARNSNSSMPLIIEVPEFIPGALIRSRNTEMLRSMNPSERRLALRDVFKISRAYRRGIAGRNILLVDDIYTTGATADACSRALLDGGAANVYLLTLASGGNRKPDFPDDCRA